jgi:hypothetical protein
MNEAGLADYHCVWYRYQNHDSPGVLRILNTFNGSGFIYIVQLVLYDY